MLNTFRSAIESLVNLIPVQSPLNPISLIKKLSTIHLYAGNRNLSQSYRKYFQKLVFLQSRKLSQSPNLHSKK